MGKKIDSEEKIEQTVVDSETKTKKKGKRIALEILEWTGVVICVAFIAFVAIFASKDPRGNSSASIFGFETKLVVSGSMDQANESFYSGKNWKIKRIKTGSLVFIKKTQNVSDLRVGDVVTFFDPKTGPSTIITHRIQEIEVNLTDLSYSKIITHGDNNAENVTEEITPGNLIGRVDGNSYFLGLMYTNVFSNKIVLAVMIFVPCALVIGFESYKIAKIVKEDKAEKAASGQLTAEEQEIYDLEKQIAEIKKKKKSKSKEGKK